MDLSCSVHLLVIRFRKGWPYHVPSHVRKTFEILGILFFLPPRGLVCTESDQQETPGSPTHTVHLELLTEQDCISGGSGVNFLYTLNNGFQTANERK